MAYVNIDTRTTSDPNSQTDINQLMINISELKGGNATAAPVSDIATLASAGGGSSVFFNFTIDGVALTGTDIISKAMTSTENPSTMFLKTDVAPSSRLVYDVNNSGVSIGTIGLAASETFATIGVSATLTQFNIISVDCDLAPTSGTLGGESTYIGAY